MNKIKSTYLFNAAKQTPYKYKQQRREIKLIIERQAATDRYNKFYGTNITVFDLLRMHGINEGSMFDPAFNCKMPQYYMDPAIKLSPKLKLMVDGWVKQLGETK